MENRKNKTYSESRDTLLTTTNCLEQSENETEGYTEYNDFPLFGFVEKLECMICGYSSQDPTQVLRHIRKHVHLKKTDLFSSTLPTSAEFVVSPCKTDVQKNTSCEDNAEAHCSNENMSVHVYDSQVSKTQSNVGCTEPKNALCKRFLCQDCGFKCNLHSSLTNHMLTHTVKRFSCSDCGLKFHKRGNLHDHMKIHLDIKDYVCSLCSYKFRRKSDLKRHSLQHTSDKPYQCPICDYRCKQPGHLQQHIRVHTNEKPYKCNWCIKCFKQPSQLAKHLKTHSIAVRGKRVVLSS